MFIAVEPNAANQKKLTIVGIKSTPTKNSRMVRPFDTRVDQIETNGDQEIHQAH